MSQETKVCFKCNWMNPIHARFCEFCNANLPMIDRDVETKTFEYIERTVVKKIVDVGWYSPKFKQILAAAEGVINGTGPVKRFQRLVEQMHQKIIDELYGDNGVRTSLKKFVREENSDRADEIMDLCLDALYTYDDAMEELKLYFKDKQIYHIEEGLEMALEAKNNLAEVLSTLDEDTGEYSKCLRKLN